MSVFITFTAAELWLLCSLIKPATKHIGFESEGAQAQPGSTRLNNQLADALIACEDSKLEEYTLDLTREDLLLISYVLEPSYKTPEGASGKQILLKTFRARQKDAGLILAQIDDRTYSEATGKEKNDANDPSEDTGAGTDESTSA